MYASTLTYRPYQLIPFGQVLTPVKADKNFKVLYCHLKRSYSFLMKVLGLSN